MLAKLAAKRLPKIQQNKASDPDKVFPPYRFEPNEYIKKYLGWVLWSGNSDHPGQRQVLDAYVLALRQQHERDDYDNGVKTVEQLEYWQPGQTIQNWIRVEAGHTVGKTKLASGIVSHFFDCFRPSIVYAFAPTYTQINDLLFKEIRTDREGRDDFPGMVHKTPEVSYKGNHFIKGRATSDAGGRGTERIQGQHGKYLLFILDEAEGIDGYVYNAVRSMASGGIVIVLMLANPRTRASNFYKLRTLPEVINFRVSCLYHPNVLQNREVVPGAVRREYVNNMLVETEVVSEHNADDHTFELPWEPGVIRRPSAEFMFRVLGIPPANLADDTFCPLGRFEAAKNREPFSGDDPTIARLGVDVARYGSDRGTIYVRHAGKVYRAAEISQQDGYTYYEKCRDELMKLAELGVKNVQVRVDGGGGYGSTCIDNLKRNDDLHRLFTVQDDRFGEVCQFTVLEVHNNGIPDEETKYADLITEMYAHAGEALKELAIIDPPQNLEVDLCERNYRTVTKGAKEVKKITPKENFKAIYGRSPDDGDGFVYAVAPDFLFSTGTGILWV